MGNYFLDKTWRETPEHIRRFYENIETNNKLCTEVEFILKSELDRCDIEIAHLSSRTKTLESFCEKINRKSYKNPFDEITDFSGVRIVYLYSSDRKLIEEIIERNFEIIEKVDKSKLDDEKFGYGALHYLVKIRSSNGGARYEELKNKVCELQVRTILQDAWAVVANHLSYKQESDVPRVLRRKLNALSGLFETADDQFEIIKNARLAYKEEVQSSIPARLESMIGEETNLDEFIAYIRDRFTDRSKCSEEDVAELLDDLKHHGYSTLVSINELIENAANAVEAYEVQDRKEQVYDVGFVRLCLAFTSEDYFSSWTRGGSDEKYKEYKALVGKIA